MAGPNNFKSDYHLGASKCKALEFYAAGAGHDEKGNVFLTGLELRIVFRPAFHIGQDEMLSAQDCVVDIEKGEN